MNKKKFFAFTYSIVVFIGVIFMPMGARAIPVETLADIPSAMGRIWDDVIKYGEIALKEATKAAIDTALGNFIQRIAYDTATYLVTGDEGQKPLFATQGWSEYLEQQGEAAAADAVGLFANFSGLDRIGLNLCNPNPQVQIVIFLGLLNQYNPPAPRCSWKQITENWDALITFEPEELQSALLKVFQPGGNDLGFYFAAFDAIEAKKSIVKEGAINQRLEGSGFWPKTTKSGQIETPAVVGKRFMDTYVVDATDSFNLQATIGAYISGSGLVFARVFVNTALNAYFQKLLREGFLEADEFADPEDVFARFGGGRTPGGSQTPQVSFAALKTPIIQDSGTMNILGEMIVCSVGSRTSLFNCTIDQGMLNLLQEAERGTAKTVRQALDESLLPDWPLIPANIDNRPENCVPAQKHCYENLVKLRRLRIIPVGWELAANLEANRNRAQPITISEAVAQFNNEGSPFYRLVDPDWVLRAPTTQCKANVPGEILRAPGTDQRMNTCVDMPSCLKQDAKGQCVGGYGYCLEEKKFWQVAGDSCDAKYASCRTLTNESAGGREQATLLLDTVTTQGCSGDIAAGCRKYATWRENGNWTFDGTHELDFEPGIRRENRVFLNQLASSCKPIEAGCTELEAGQEDVFLRVAPAYMYCYDGNPLNDDARCREFAPTCEKPGCEKYTPLNGGESLTAVATQADQCDSACVGYENYVAAPLWWDASAEHITSPRGGVNFIAKSGTSCPVQEAGCEEYTNLDTVAEGGEGREYYSFVRQCVKPGNGEAPFYTWEGTDQEGYQLRTWTLLPSNQNGGPCTNVNPLTNQCTDDANPQAICREDEVGLNPNCRRFYNQRGDIFYRLFDRAVLASNECHPYRKTLADVTGDGQANAQDCAAGHFDAARGECRFQAVPTQGRSCAPRNNGCRLYRGPRAGAAQLIFEDTFESGSEWSVLNGAVSADASEPGGHSLKIIAYGRARELRASRAIPRNAGSFMVSWWMKYENAQNYNIAQNIRVTVGNETAVVPLVGLFEEWVQMTAGPFDIPEPQENLTLTISGNFERAVGVRASRAAVNAVFIDNVKVSNTAEIVSVIQNSWTTPAICEAPRSQLHCRAYRNRTGSVANLTGFTDTCNEENVGCTQFVDRFNLTGNRNGQAFNAGGSQEDDVTIPPPQFISLIRSPLFQCAPEARGCQEVGVVTQTDSNGDPTTIETTHRINDPDRYLTLGGAPGTLCQTQQEFCDVYRDSQGSKVVFKNPGGRTCAWREAGSDPAIRTSGWFVTGTSDPCVPGAPANNSFVGLCPEQQNFCTELVDSSGVAKGEPEQPYFLIHNQKIDDESCNGQVNREDGCVLFNDTFKKNIATGDPNLTWSTAATYARAGVAQLSGKRGIEPVSCSDGINDRIFLRASGDPRVDEKKDFLVASGYRCRAEHSEGDFGVFEGYSCTMIARCANDANIILKVALDRMCSSWLECRSKQTTFDPQTGNFREICTELARCTEYDPDTRQCKSYDDRPAVELNINRYKDRNTSWEGADWSGYSIPNEWPLERVRAGFDEGGDRFIAARLDGRPANEPGSCLDGEGRLQPDGTVCTASAVPFGERAGVCIQGACMIRFTEADQGDLAFACRGFAEKTSPFPPVVATRFRLVDGPSPWNAIPEGFVQGFEQVNTFAVKNPFKPEEGLGAGVNQCHYKTFGYGGGGFTKRFGEIGTVAPPDGICSGGSRHQNGFRESTDGNSCDPDLDTEQQQGEGECGRGGTCLALTKINTFKGWEGLCVERDHSVPINGQNNQFACLTWLPVDQVGADIFNDVEAASVSHEIRNTFNTSTLAYCAQGAIGVNRPFEIARGACGNPRISRASLESCFGIFDDIAPADPDRHVEAETSAGPDYNQQGGAGGFHVGAKNTGSKRDDDLCPVYCIPPGFSIPRDQKNLIDIEEGEVCNPQTFNRNNQGDKVEIYAVMHRRGGTETIWTLNGTRSESALKCRGNAILGAYNGVGYFRPDAVPDTALTGICTDVVFLSDERAVDLAKVNERPMLRADKFYSRRQYPPNFAQGTTPYSIVPGTLDPSAVRNGLDPSAAEQMRFTYLRPDGIAASDRPYYPLRDTAEFEPIALHPPIEICVGTELPKNNPLRYKMSALDQRLDEGLTICTENQRDFELFSDEGDKAGAFGAFTARIVGQRIQHIREGSEVGLRRLSQLAHKFTHRRKLYIEEEVNQPWQDFGPIYFDPNAPGRREPIEDQDFGPIPGDSVRPIVASVVEPNPGEQASGPLGTISVNKKSSGDIVGVNLVTAQVSFYAWANHDQSPLTKVSINWGDGTPFMEIGGPVRLQNRKPFCEPGKLVKECFVNGDSNGATCEEDRDCERNPGEQVSCRGVGTPAKECFVNGDSNGATCEENRDCAAFGGNAQCQDDGFHFGNSSDPLGANACTARPFNFAHGYVFERNGSVPCEGIRNFAFQNEYRGRRCKIYEGGAPTVRVTDWWNESSQEVRYNGRIIVVESRR